MNWLQCSRLGEALRIYHDLDIAGVEFFHAALEDDASVIDEHEISQNVLDLFHLMGSHDDGAAAVEVIVQQRIVELFAIKDVEAKRRLVQDQQLRVDRHDQREMQLRDHP